MRNEAVTPHQATLAMIAEGDAQRRTLYEVVLREAGYNVIEVTDARAMAAAHLVPALIIVQLVNPNLAGFALFSELRTRADTRDTPVIVLTRFDDVYTREQIVRSGATAILVEPLRPALLLRQVRRLLARRPLVAGAPAAVRVEKSMVTPPGA
jgi:DNA-binding response OmpR family regulator